MTAPYLDTHKAIIGTSGAGKTVTAKDEVEALMLDRRHLAIIDPTGAWWGLRSNAAGDGPGFDIPIFGGDHGDVAIEPDQGEVVGNIIAGGVSAIVDVSNMDGRDQRRFVLGMMRALRRKPKGNFHLVVDEADEFAPQTAPDDFGFQLAEQMAWVAKRGRLAGFVLTAITQRPADITKAVLSQVQTIIAHQLIAPQDQKAIDDYLKANGDAATRKTVMSSLAGLARGERWIYSPRLGLLERGVTPMPSTFDSSRTPEPGETPTEPKMLAQIDIGAIRKALAPKVEEAANELPATDNSGEILKLRERITALEAERDNWIIESAVGQQKLDALVAENRAIRDIAQRFADAAADLALIRPALDDMENWPDPVVASPETPRQPSPAPAKSASPRPQPRAAPVGAIPASQQRVLDAIAWWGCLGFSHIERRRACVIAGLSPKASTFGVYISKLAQAGLVDVSQQGMVGLTEEGVKVANRPDGISKSQVVTEARAMLNPAAQGVFDRIVAAHPDWISRDQLADDVGLSRTASTLGVYISKAGQLGFVETKPGHVRASDWLFP